MKFSPSNSTGHPVVPERSRCIWMTAGILSYQLCDRQFDCDHCPLDSAMRMHFGPERDARTTSRPAREAFAADIEKEVLLYSRNHCWLRAMENGIVRVGLEPGFASILVAPKAVALPSIGEMVKPNHVCCWIILEGGTIPLTSPVAGTIVATNGHITDVPYELHVNPLSHGWLFSLRPDPHAMTGPDLLKKEESEQLYAADAARFSDLLIDALRGNSMSIGATLQDGGQVLEDASAMLGPKRYFELVREAYEKVKP